MHTEKFGLCFAGGGAKGAYQTGVWKALRESGMDSHVAAVSGTSIGGITSALFAQGNLERAEEMWDQISLEKLITWDTKSFEERMKPYLHAAMAGSITWFSARFQRRGIISQEGLIQMIRGAMDLEIFRDLSLPVTVCASEFTKEFPPRPPQPRYIRLNGKSPEEVETFLLASAAIPLVFSGVPHEGKFLLDGYMTDNTPITPLIKEGCNTLLAVQLDGDADLPEKQTSSEGIVCWNILPSVESKGILGGLNFTPEFIRHMREAGYRDTLKTIRTLEGHLRAGAHAMKSAEKIKAQAEEDPGLGAEEETRLPAPLTEKEKALVLQETRACMEEYQENAAELARVAFEAITAISPVDSRVRQRARQGVFGRLWKNLTGENTESINADLHNMNKALGASQEMIRILTEQGALTLDVLGTLHNRTRILEQQILQQGEHYARLEDNLQSFQETVFRAFQYQQGELRRHEGMLQNHEKRLQIQEWLTSLGSRVFQGRGYRELPPGERLWLCTSEYLALPLDNPSSNASIPLFMEALHSLELDSREITLEELLTPLQENSALHHQVSKNLQKKHILKEPDYQKALGETPPDPGATAPPPLGKNPGM